MDYDKTQMPGVYDAGRGYGPEALRMWMERIAGALGRDRFDTILDIGCGTGRFSAPLAEHFRAQVTGYDPSEKMIAEARRKGGANVSFRIAPAEDLPAGDDSADLVFLSMVVHHFNDADAALGEVARVLRPGGLVAVRGGSAEHIPDYPYAAFFPGTEPLLREHVPPLAEVSAPFAAAGLVLRNHLVVESPVAADWQAFVGRTALRADSILVRLGEEEFAQGMERLAAHAAAHPGEGPITQPVDLFVFEHAA